MYRADELIEIVPFEDRYAKEFKRLNRECLNRYEHFELVDLEYLNQPHQVIIEPGGKILMAVTNGTIAGTCAIKKETCNRARFARLAVSPGARRKGIGRLLTVVSINLAQKMGFKKLVLVSNKNSATAIRLYESLGFKPGPVPEDTIHGSADMYMELKIC